MNKILILLLEKLLEIQIYICERMINMGTVEVSNKKIEVANLAITYSHVIALDLKTFNQAPKRFKLDIAICLIAFGYPEKVTDEAYLKEAYARIEEAE